MYMSYSPQSLCEDKERKFQKELVKAKEPAITQEKLRQATDAKNLADAEGQWA